MMMLLTAVFSLLRINLSFFAFGLMMLFTAGWIGTSCLFASVVTAFANSGTARIIRRSLLTTVSGTVRVNPQQLSPRLLRVAASMLFVRA